MKWRDYQEQTAQLFRSLGYQAVTDQQLTGARGKHKIDVVIRFSKHAFSCLWIIECKLWARNVPKEKVLALQSIVEDVGADKGIMLSEKGFQSGCFACASRTNILLSSLSKLRGTHQEDLHRAFVDSLLIEIKRATKQARKLAPTEKVSLGNNSEVLRTRFPMELLGRVYYLESALNKYRDGHLPVVVSLGDDGNRDTPVLANSQDDIVSAQQDVLARINDLIVKLETSPD
jgi:Restriction endonuclease